MLLVHEQSSTQCEWFLLPAIWHQRWFLIHSAMGASIVLDSFSNGSKYDLDSVAVGLGLIRTEGFPGSSSEKQQLVN
jgi:hypothetical protein